MIQFTKYLVFLLGLEDDFMYLASYPTSDPHHVKEWIKIELATRVEESNSLQSGYPSCTIFYYELIVVINSIGNSNLGEYMVVGSVMKKIQR